MDRFNFLKMLQGITSGDGILVEKVMSLRDINLFSDGSTLTTASAPKFAKLETNATGIVWVASSVAAVGLEVHIPDDYDSAQDIMELHLQVGMSSTTDTPGLTANVYKKTNGTALSADLGPFTAITRVKAVESTFAAAVGTTGSKSAIFKISAKSVNPKVAGAGLLAGDTLTCKITPGAHGTDALNVYGVWIKYRSDIVSYDPSSPKR